MTKARVLKAFFEYRAVYRRPLLDRMTLDSELVPPVFESLRKWNIELENLSWKQNPMNAGEVQALFQIMGGRMALSLWLGHASLLVTDPDWSQADLIPDIVSAAVSALRATGRVEIDKQHASTAMHLQADGRSKKEITEQFVKIPSVSGSPVTGYGVSVYRDDSAWVADTSALYPDALFVRINRMFSTESTPTAIAVSMRNDENSVLGLLGLEVD